MEEEDLFGSSPPDTADCQDDSPQPELKPLPAVLHLDDQPAESRQDAPLTVVHEKLNTPTKVLEANESRRKSDPKFVCPVESCETTFTRPHNLACHMRSHNGDAPFLCEVCGRGFGRPSDCRRHQKLHSPPDNVEEPSEVASLSQSSSSLPALSPADSVSLPAPDEFASTIDFDFDAVANGASLEDLAFILGEGGYLFPTEDASPEPPVETPVQQEQERPMTKEEEKASINAAIREYGRVFTYVHAKPPTQPPPPFPDQTSPFEQTLTPPEVLVWLSHCSFPELAKDKDTLRLFVRLMTWMDKSSSAPPTISPGSGTQKRLAGADRVEMDSPNKRIHLETAGDVGLFTDDFPPSSFALDLDYSTSLTPSSAGFDDFPDSASFATSGDLNAFPLPEEFHQFGDFGESYAPLPDVSPSVIPSGMPLFPATKPPPPPQATPSLSIPVPKPSVARPVAASSARPLAHAPPPKPAPPLKTGPRKPKPRHPNEVAMPCTYVDPATGIQCTSSFVRLFDLKRHAESVHESKNGSKFICNKCSKAFTRRDAMVRHQKLYCCKKSENGRLERTTQQQAFVPAAFPAGVSASPPAALPSFTPHATYVPQPPSYAPNPHPNQYSAGAGSSTHQTVG